MKEKKYELIPSDKKGFFRVKALRDFGNVKAGDIGGYVEGEHNLSHEGDCWIYDNAKVLDNASVCGNASVLDNAIIGANAKVFENAYVYGNAIVIGYANVYCNARVCGDVNVFDNAFIHGNAFVHGKAIVYGSARVYGNAMVSDNAKVSGNAFVYGNADVHGSSDICGNAVIEKNGDYVVFQNTWSSGRYFTWTRSNNMWCVGCFYGTGKELIKKAYKDSKLSGKMYKKYVKFVESQILNKGILNILKDKILKIF